ncbi:hypothetical protein V8C26DRAFT_388324 [Trichoderma gracile]
MNFLPDPDLDSPGLVPLGTPVLPWTPEMSLRAQVGMMREWVSLEHAGMDVSVHVSLFCAGMCVCVNVRERVNSLGKTKKACLLRGCIVLSLFVVAGAGQFSQDSRSASFCLNLHSFLSPHLFSLSRGGGVSKGKKRLHVGIH